MEDSLRTWSIRRAPAPALILVPFLVCLLRLLHRVASRLVSAPNFACPGSVSFSRSVSSLAGSWFAHLLVRFILAFCLVSSRASSFRHIPSSFASFHRLSLPLITLTTSTRNTSSPTGLHLPPHCFRPTPVAIEYTPQTPLIT